MFLTKSLILVKIYEDTRKYLVTFSETVNEDKKFHNFRNDININLLDEMLSEGKKIGDDRFCKN